MVMLYLGVIFMTIMIILSFYLTLWTFDNLFKENEELRSKLNIIHNELISILKDYIEDEEKPPPEL